jgi:KaiC/GvpD/RAD55 family RecA-like ATPase
MSNIDLVYQMRVERNEYIKMNWSLGMKWPYQFFDYSQGIVRKKVYTIWAFSNTGKSKLAYNLAWKLMHSCKVLYVSIEEWLEDMFANIVAWNENLPIEDLFMHDISHRNYYNLYLSDSCRTIKEIDTLVKEQKSDIVFIDYIQWMFDKWSAYEKNAKIALDAQRLAIENNCTVFSLAQLSNAMARDQKMWLEWQTSFIKWAGEYYAASDVIYMLARDEQTQQIQMKIEKNKLWYRWAMYDVNIDYRCNQFNFTQINRNF